MTTTTIVIESCSLRKSSRGNVLGNVWFQVGEECFPSTKWNDFVLPILAWWAEAVLELDVDTKPVRLDFMDGPYSVDGKPGVGDSISLLCLLGAERETEALRCNARLSDLIKSLVDCSSSVLGFCAENDISSAAVDSLRTSLRKLLMHPSLVDA